MPTKILKLTAEGTVTLKAADAAEGSAARKFSMVAYTGGRIDQGWGYSVVVDLAGLKKVKAKKPIFLDHDSSQRVGHSERAEITADHKLIVEGVVSGASPASKEVVESSLAGFPWQASIGAAVEKTVFVDEGKSVTVNGQEFEGPIYVVRASTLKEVSFVSLGADDATTASVAASAANLEIETMTFEAFLAARGLKLADLSDAQTKAFRADHEKLQAAAPPANQPPAPSTDPTNDIRAKASAEVNRLAGIRDICAKYPAGLKTEIEVDGKKQQVDIQAHAIEAGWDVKETELHLLRAKRPDSPAIHSNNGCSDPQVLEAALCVSALMPNVEKKFKPETLELAHKHYRGLGLQQLLIEAACANGYVCGPGARITDGNLSDILAHAMPPRYIRASGFSTVSLPGILGNVANKELLEGYSEEDQTWREIASVKPVNNFHAHTSYRMLDDMEYEEVGPTGEIKHGKVDQESYTRQAKTYAKMFALTRTDIINDDLGAFDDIRTRLGRGAAVKFNNLFWAAFINNSTLFPTDNSLTNYIEGGTTNLGLDGVGLKQGVQAYRKMRSPSADGTKRVGVGSAPSILLVPPELESIAETLFKATNLAAVKASDANIYANKYRPVVQNRLSDSAFTGYSATAWYLFGSMLKPMVVSFLNGQQTPTVESADADFDQLGIQFRGYHDFGADRSEYLAGIKSKGAA